MLASDRKDQTFLPSFVVHGPPSHPQSPGSIQEPFPNQQIPDRALVFREHVLPSLPVGEPGADAAQREGGGFCMSEVRGEVPAEGDGARP